MTSYSPTVRRVAWRSAVRSVRAKSNHSRSFRRALVRAHRAEQRVIAALHWVRDNSQLLWREVQLLERSIADHDKRLRWLNRQLEDAPRRPSLRIAVTRLWLRCLSRNGRLELLESLERSQTKRYEELRAELYERELMAWDRALLRRQRFTEARVWQAAHLCG